MVMRYIYVQGEHITVGTQLDIEGGMALEDAFWVEYSNNSRADGKVISLDKNEVTIEVGKQQIRVRRATAADHATPTGSKFLSSWIVTEAL